jgi:hypothetical protein
MNVKFDAFLPDVLPHVPSCPDNTALIAIRNAAIEFCEKSYAWQVDVDPIVIIKNEPEYDIDVPSNTTVVEITLASIGSRKIEPRSADELVHAYGTDWRQRVGAPMFYHRLRPDDTMRLVPIPDEAFVAVTPKPKLNVREVLAPSRKATQCDQILYDSWVEGIAAGALQRLFAMVGQSFYNPMESAHYGSIYRGAIGDAMITTNKTNSRSNTRVAYVKFA